jgi:ribonucleoside-diphosphate reductase alpha chain
VAASTPPARESSSDTPRSTAAPISATVPESGSAPGTNGKSNGNGAAGLRAALGNIGVGKNQVTFAAQADAPSCADCGSIMVRNGSCYKCLNCGSTSGCS